MLRARSDGYSLDDRRQPVPDNDLPVLLRAVTNVCLPRGMNPNMGRLVPLAEIRGQSYMLNPSRFLLADQPVPEHETSLADAVEGVAESTSRLQVVLQQIQEWTR